MQCVIRSILTRNDLDLRNERIMICQVNLVDERIHFISGLFLFVLEARLQLHFVALLSFDCSSVAIGHH